MRERASGSILAGVETGQKPKRRQSIRIARGGSERVVAPGDVAGYVKRGWLMTEIVEGTPKPPAAAPAPSAPNPPTAPTPAAEPHTFEGIDVPSLRTLAKANGVMVSTHMKRSDIVAALNAAGVTPPT